MTRVRLPVIQSVLSTPRWYVGDDGWVHLLPAHDPPPSVDALTRAVEENAPVQVDRTGLGDHRRQGLPGLEVLAFPGG